MTRFYDPPAFLPDLDSDQRDGWDRYIRDVFAASTKEELIGGITTSRGSLGRLQFFCEGDYVDEANNHGVPPVDKTAYVNQEVLWNAFPKELVRRFGRAKAMEYADSLWPLSLYAEDLYDPAVPATANSSNTWTDKFSYRPAVEYCEWHVDRDSVTGAIKRVTFTSEPPEYYFLMFDGKVPDSELQFPKDAKYQQKVLDLYRTYVNPRVTLDDLKVPEDFKCGFGLLKKGDYNPYNKWNTTHGCMHLTAPPNSLAAEIGLAAACSAPYYNDAGKAVVNADAIIAGAGLGGANRNSDPTIVGTVNVLARADLYDITLANPVGLYMDHIDTAGWEFPGGTTAKDWIVQDRPRPGGQAPPRMIERMTIGFTGAGQSYAVSDIKIGGVPIAWGGQIAECITVKLVGRVRPKVDTTGAPAAFKFVNEACIDPTNARELFNGKPLRNQEPVDDPKYVPAFVDEGDGDLVAGAGVTRRKANMQAGRPKR